MNDEDALIEELRSGGQTAFDALYDLWRPRIFTFLLGLSGRRDLAQDLLQETFLRLARNATRLAPGIRLGPWLYRVARNLFISHCRWARRDFERLSHLDLLPRPTVPTPLELAVANDVERKMWRALASLPIAQREVLLLAGVGQMAPADMATALEINPEAARQRLTRARTALAEAMEGVER